MAYSAPNVRDFLLNSVASKQWQQINISHHHGIAVPLFSLRSAIGCGIGEFTDLIPLIDWCQAVGMDNLQLLPINDTGESSSPYNALSAFALNPIYLGLQNLPFIDQYPDLKEALNPLQKLNQSEKINYRQVLEGKEQLLRRYYKQIHPQLAQEQAYIDFIQDSPWLKPYCLFKVLKEKMQGSSWESWPEEIRNPSPELLQSYYEKYRNEIEFHQFIQYLCFDQMKAVKHYASMHHFLIQGDIPILMNRDSADVWLNRTLFDLNFSAGSSPDIYSEQGQNWGLPIYSWAAHEQDNYLWWRARLRTASLLYHLYRIDHAVGFFRIWAIPQGATTHQGRYIPEDHTKWIPAGEKIIRMMLEETDMMPIAEDLGVIPPEVRSCLHRLGICGTKVMRWERMWNEDRRFIPPEDYIPDSMTTISTHDSETLQLWWQHLPQEARDFCYFKGWEYQPNLTKEQRFEILHDSHHTGSLFHINPLQEYLALFPDLISLNPEDERINIPGLVSDRNWSYRLKPSVEQLIKHRELNEEMRKLIL